MNQTFDERMRKRAQTERMSASAATKEKLRQAMYEGASQRSNKRTYWKQAVAAAMALAVAAAVVFLQPPKDPAQNAALLAQSDELVSPVPVTELEASMELKLSNRTLQANATFSNHTGDIWLIHWWAEPKGSVQPVSQPTGLIWLEAGITYTDDAAWMPTDAPVTEADWGYQAYRVKADVLHWLDGEWLIPGQEGYENQQELMEDAFKAGALILCPGDWPEGTSGEMQLILPDSQTDLDELAFYCQAGMLEMATSKEDTAKIP